MDGAYAPGIGPAHVVPADRRSHAGGREADAGDRGWFRIPVEQLYDIRTDPGEQRNLVRARPEVALVLRDRLQTHARTQGEVSAAGISPEAAAELRALGYLHGDDTPDTRR
jgi:hypothetical protein